MTSKENTKWITTMFDYVVKKNIFTERKTNKRNMNQKLVLLKLKAKRTKR